MSCEQVEPGFPVALFAELFVEVRLLSFCEQHFTPSGLVQIAKKRAEEELGSLREVYAMQIANTEMKGEWLICEKDD